MFQSTTPETDLILRLRQLWQTRKMNSGWILRHPFSFMLLPLSLALVCTWMVDLLKLTWTMATYPIHCFDSCSVDWSWNSRIKVQCNRNKIFFLQWASHKWAILYFQAESDERSLPAILYFQAGSDERSLPAWQYNIAHLWDAHSKKCDFLFVGLLTVWPVTSFPSTNKKIAYSRLTSCNLGCSFQRWSVNPTLSTRVNVWPTYGG